MFEKVSRQPTNRPVSTTGIVTPSSRSVSGRASLECEMANETLINHKLKVASTGGYLQWLANQNRVFAFYALID